MEICKVSPLGPLTSHTWVIWSSTSSVVAGRSVPGVTSVMSMVHGGLIQLSGL